MISFLILVVSLFASIYVYVTRYNDFWKKAKIPYEKPYPFIGNLDSILLGKISIGEYINKLYRDYEGHPYVGIFLADKPCLVVRDYEMALNILHRDFEYFNRRILFLASRTDPIGAKSLFILQDKEWKNTRAKVSPIFTSKKNKIVFDAMMRVGEKFENLLRKEKTINIKELSTSIVVDMVSDAVLRFEGQGMTDPENDQFLKLGNMLFSEGLKQSIKNNLSFLAPEVLAFFRIPVFDDEAYQIMRDAVKKAVDIKKSQNNTKGDYLDALLELADKGSWEGNNGEIIVPDNENLVAQFFMFFAAGYETIGSGVLYCLYEIANNPDIQEKIRKELKECCVNHGGTITYEALKEMSYLHKYIVECLRKNPPFPFIDRLCSKDYVIPGTDVTMKKGFKLIIPMMGLHRDNKYYEDPDKIIPERFDNIDIEKPRPYFPFSNGPRLCLGKQYALQLLKVISVCTLRNHRLSVSEKTPKIIRMSPKRFGNTPLHDILLDVHKLY